MGAKTTAGATATLTIILNNFAWTGVGDAGGILPSAADGNIYLSLHSADPGVGGNQTTNELSYTGYARIPVSRDGTQWTIAAGSASNAADLLGALCTAGSGVATFVGIGTDAVGAGNLLYRGTILIPVAGLTITPGITPKIVIGSAVVTES
jgi:hypothetical protein